MILPERATAHGPVYYGGSRAVYPDLGALADFERNLIRERTQAGLQAARARGRKGGRPKSLSIDKRKPAVRFAK
jgi:hypothetical protein